MKTKIDFGWEVDEDRLRRWIKLSPKKKMEWLFESHTLMRKALSSKQREIFWKLREANTRI